MSNRITWEEHPPRKPEELYGNEPSYTGRVGTVSMFSVYYKPSHGWVAAGQPQWDTRDVTPKSAAAAKSECERALTKYLKDLGAVLEPTAAKAARRSPLEMLVSRLGESIEHLEEQAQRYNTPQYSYADVARIMRELLGPIKFVPTIRWESGQRLHHEGYVGGKKRFRIEPHDLFPKQIMLYDGAKNRPQMVTDVADGKKRAAEILEAETK